MSANDFPRGSLCDRKRPGIEPANRPLVQRLTYCATLLSLSVKKISACMQKVAKQVSVVCLLSVILNLLLLAVLLCTLTQQLLFALLVKAYTRYLRICVFHGVVRYLPGPAFSVPLFRYVQGAAKKIPLQAGISLGQLNFLLSNLQQ